MFQTVKFVANFKNVHNFEARIMPNPVFWGKKAARKASRSKFQTRKGN